MASYLPNHQAYIPQLQPFTPDYKFLSNVLEQRQNRYDKNYNAINNLYGQVVYAPLTRDDNKEKRDQYANDLSNSLKQVSGLDLSLHQNVETAKALFKPFYDDEELVQDMFRTRRYQEEQKNMTEMKNSNIKKRRDNYWTYGDRFMQQNMEKFKTLSADEAYNLPMPEYVENPNLFEEGQRLLSDPNLDGDTSDAMKIEYTDFVGDFIVTYENGKAMTNFEYTDEDGVQRHKNWGTEWLAQALQDDPKVQRGYYVMGQVVAEDWIQANLEEYGGNRSTTQKAWDDKIIKESVDAQIVQLSETETALLAASLSAESWEEYKKANGIVEGTAEAELLNRKKYEVQLAENSNKRLIDRIENLKSPTDDPEGYHQKALISFMSMQIGEQMDAAATKYAQGTAKIEMETNEPLLEQKKRLFETAEREAKEAFEWDKMMQEHQNKLEQIDAEGGKGTSNKGNRANQISSILDDIVMSGNMNITGIPTQENPEQYSSGWETLYTAYEGTRKMKWAQISLMYNNIKLAQNELSGGAGPGSFEIIDGGKKVNKSLEEAMQFLLQPENSNELDRLYNQVMKWTNETDEVETENGKVTLQRFSPDDPGWNMYVGDDPNTEEKEGTPLRVLLAANETDIMGNMVMLPKISKEYKKTIQNSFRYIKKNQPSSEYSINARNGYADKVAPKAVWEGMRWGFTEGDLYAPEDATRQDGSSHWDWMEKEFKARNLLKPDDQLTAEELKMTVRERIMSTPLDHMSDSDYRNFQMLSFQGLSTGGKDENGWYHDDNAEERTAEYLNKYFWDDVQGAKQQKFFSGWNSARGEVWNFDKDRGWYFDSIKAQEGINNHLQLMSNELNTLWSDDKAMLNEKGIPHPTVVQDVFNLDVKDAGSGLIVYPVSNTNFDTRLPSESAMDNFEAALQAYKASDATTTIVGGNWSTKFPEETVDDPMAKQALGILFGQVQTGLNSDLESNQTNFLMSWTQAGGGEGSRTDADGDGIDEYHSLYTFDLTTTDILDKLKTIEGPGYKDGELKDNIKFEESDIYKSKKISMLVDQEFDKMYNNKNLINNRPDGLTLLVNEMGPYSPPHIPAGGRLTVYKDDSGNMRMKVESQGFNTESGNVEWDPGLITNRIIDPNMISAEVAQQQFDFQTLAIANYYMQNQWKELKKEEAKKKEEEKNKQ